MKLSTPLLRGSIVAACAVALAVVPSISGVGAAVHAAAKPKPASTSEATPTSNTELRAPAPPPSAHPTQRPGYVAPTSSRLQTAAVAGPKLAAAVVPTAAANPASARTWGDTTSATSTLVLYDTTNTFGWLGELYAMAAGNLASHFGSVTAEPVVDYQSGQVNNFTATMYIGSTYNEPIPVTFLNDVITTTHQVMWLGFNVWQLDGTPATATTFQAAYGWDPATSFFDDVDAVTQVSYNGAVLTRNSDSGQIVAPHITSTTNQVTVLASAQCGTTTAPVACAPIAQTAAGATTFPWAIKSANLTYLGEIPLSYITEQDRYLVFSDLMFGLLAPTAPVVHQALVRLEDVSPGLDTPAEMMADADYLSSVNVPFSVGVIPVYTDPNGFFDGTPVTYDISQTSNPTIAAFDAALQYMVSKGGTIIEHGYTHQYSNVRNPFSAVSGDDFEFYRSQCSTTQNPPYNFDDSCAATDWVIQEGPLPGDSATFASSRVTAGKALFAPAGLATPTIWETPHYSASAVDYQAFNSVYQTRYEREQFFGGQLSGITANSTHVFGQFYPYAVRDVYGTTVIPEDLGNYEPDAIYNTLARPPATIIANAAAELSVRQGVASFFFHPYYDVTELQQIVAGIQALGFTFVAPTAVIPATTAPAVTAIAPTTGPTTGATSVTITGTGLAGATSVKFGTVAAAIVSTSATSIVATSPAGAAGVVDVTVTTPGGTSAVVAGDKFTYGTAPAVTAIAPTTGPAAGATSVTITGTNLTGATSVKFGTVAAAIVSNTATQIVATSPAGAAGVVDVTVTTALGTSAVVNGDKFTYGAAPAVTGLSPTTGPAAGATSVTITGTNLTGATSVKFGTVAAAIVSNTATQIVATSPAGAAGVVDVTVTTPNGTSGIVAGDKFTYGAAPAVTGLSPTTGPTTGATAVTITGTNLTGATSVKFGTATAAIVSNTATQIVATSPAGAAGVVDVTVTTPNGASGIVAGDKFTYATPAPAVTQIAPNTGPTTGGTSVTITGTNLTGATGVKFGTATAAIVSNTATQIVVTNPAGTAGVTDVTVTTPTGTSTIVSADQFTYISTPPAVSSISPTSGPAAGGTSVTITGTNFTGATGVQFGTTTAAIVSNTATQIVATSPAGTGTVDVKVTTTAGTSNVVTGDQFTYVLPPAGTVTSISPTSGPAAGGTSVTITGTNLTGATSVTFGTAPATIVSNTATQIVATSPAGTGTVDVLVTTVGGTSGVVNADKFTYIAGPAVTKITPTSGPAAGGTKVTITGTNLTGATSVQFGTTAATITSTSATQIVATSPKGVPGVVDVRVVTPGGTSPAVTADRFTYIGATTTKLTASAILNSRVTFTATVASASGGSTLPTGTVRFADGFNTIAGCSAVAVSNGKATCTVGVTRANRGTHNLSATYGGNTLFTGSVGTLIFTVR